MNSESRGVRTRPDELPRTVRTATYRILFTDLRWRVRTDRSLKWDSVLGVEFRCALVVPHARSLEMGDEQTRATGELGESHFRWVVEAMAELVIALAKEGPGHSAPPTWEKLLHARQ